MSTTLYGRILNQFALSGTSTIDFPAVDSTGKDGKPKTLYASFTLDVDVAENDWDAVLAELLALDGQTVKVRYPRTEHVAGALKWRLKKNPWHTGASLHAALSEMMLSEEEKDARTAALLAAQTAEQERLRLLAEDDQKAAAAKAEEERVAAEKVAVQTTVPDTTPQVEPVPAPLPSGNGKAKKGKTAPVPS